MILIVEELKNQGKRPLRFMEAKLTLADIPKFL
jgi:hypothetical protein